MTQFMNIPNSKIVERLLSLQLDTTKLHSTINGFSTRSKGRGESIIESIKYVLQNRKQGARNLMELLDLTLVDIFKDKIFTPIIFNIFGCNLSTDIDMVIVVPEIIDETLLDLSYIHSIVGSDKTIDISQIVVKDNEIVLSSKGSAKETQNMVYYTYDNHKQYCPPIFIKPTINVDIFDRVTHVSKFTLDKLEELDNNIYIKYKDMKKILYQDQIIRVRTINDILSTYIITNLNSILKSICVKIFQTIICINCPEKIPSMYSKIPLAQEIAAIYGFDSEYIIALITRGKYGIVDMDQINKCFQIIIKDFIIITDNILLDFTFLQDNINYSVNMHPSDILSQQYLLSPIVPTQQFIDTMQQITPEMNLSKVFVGSTNYKEVIEFLDTSFVESKIELAVPRSDEWLRLLTYYKTGKHTGLVPFTGSTFSDWVTTYYNLCRGCISENLIIDFCDFSKILSLDVVKFTCGLLVDSKTKGAIACAPDLLLIEKISRKIIPVEIKSIVGKAEYSANFAREIKLARLQLMNAKELLGSYYYGFGLIVIMFSHNHEIRYNKIDL